MLFATPCCLLLQVCLPAAAFCYTSCCCKHLPVPTTRQLVRPPPSALHCVGSQAGGRPTLPVILRDKSAVVLYKWEDEVYCSDANSTAFKFPLVDAKLLERAQPPSSSLR